MDRPEAITPTIFILFFSSFLPNLHSLLFQMLRLSFCFFQYFFHIVFPSLKTDQ
ncbi:transport and binding protein [Centipeda periodontii DSM 2778]|uniref:Transport and binding protein n=1 Tax=Centipeda periodontii DSM 2778 TaxID=888060 RepID=F5RNF2_9FIRM|nr:transport and binding protein [Centipeda periodontii DSM 2778]